MMRKRRRRLKMEELEELDNEMIKNQKKARKKEMIGKKN